MVRMSELKKFFKEAYEEGKRSGVFQCSTLPMNMAPLPFEGWWYEHKDKIQNPNKRITDEQIEKGLNEAYEAAGTNAYFGNGFKAGVAFIREILEPPQQKEKE